jgi:hypothetical protein
MLSVPHGFSCRDACDESECTATKPQDNGILHIMILANSLKETMTITIEVNIVRT